MEVLHQMLEPVYDEKSAVLILGSFPSVKSREQGFYYGNPQNRFWKTLAAVLDSETPDTVSQKKELLLSHGIALWDVIESCSIEGSDDGSIRGVIPADIKGLLNRTSISRIFTNGGKAYALYRKFCEKETGIPAQPLPSTSPANAAWNLQRLVAAWSVILKP